MITRYFPGGKVILVDDVPPEDIAMVQALYSRSPESAELHLGKIRAESRAEGGEVRASARAGEFMRRYYVGYGHKSIGDCGSTTLFVEGVSMLCAKAIQDWPLYSGQETSTRYMDMRGRAVADPADTRASAEIVGRWMSFYERGIPRAAEEARARYPRQPGEDEVTYERAIAARSFDVMRAFLPAGTTTQLSWHTNLRQAGDHLTWLFTHPLSEVRRCASMIFEVLTEAYPSSTDAAASQLSGIGTWGEKTPTAWVARVSERRAYLDPELPCGKPDWGSDDHEAPFATTISNRTIESYPEISSRPLGCVLPHWMSDLGQVTFRLDLDFGSFRDVQRHRNGVCRMPLLGTGRGFEPWYLEQLSEEHRAEALDLIQAQVPRIAGLTRGGASGLSPAEAQCYVAMGFRVPCRLTYALPAAVYVVELRSGRTVHPTLRRAALRMAGQLRAAHPRVALHVDETLSDWDLRRGSQIIREVSS